VNYPGFYAGAYYASGSGGYSGGGGGSQEYLAYLNDAFSAASGSSSGSPGFFPFAYGEEELLFGQVQSGGGALAFGEETGEQQSYAFRRGPCVASGMCGDLSEQGPRFGAGEGRGAIVGLASRERSRLFLVAALIARE